MTKPIMIQGTGSGVGKSVTVAALCRIFSQDGLRVAPFKSQNMALNSYPAEGGGEMGRAQVVQAQACGIEPTVAMNPILIKPSADCMAQLVVLGKPQGNNDPQGYYKQKTWLRKVIKRSYQELAGEYEVIVIEGAGSPAEINLRKNDMVNMFVAKMAKAPVILVGDIDKGGVFAWIYGTIKLLTPSERRLVKGVIINKFRGDIALLEPGLEMLEKLIKIPVLGVVPYYRHIKIEEEDSVTRLPFYREAAEDKLDIAVIYLPHVSNFTDFDVFEAEDDVCLRYVKSKRELGSPDILIIPGSKSTINDLQVLRDCGLADIILELAASGTIIVGICGGFQMLGQNILDPDCVEGTSSSAKGLGLLELSSTIQLDKTTRRIKVKGINGFADNLVAEGYEIHHGNTKPDSEKPLFELQDGTLDGAISRTGRIWGTYLHGIFDNSAIRHAFLKQSARLLGKSFNPSAILDKKEFREREFDKLADHYRKHLDLKKIYEILEGAN